MSKPSFLSKNYEECIVNEKLYRFFPLSVMAYFELRQLAKPIANAISVLFADSGGDRGWVERKFEERDGTTGSVTEAEAISLEKIEYREDKKRQALEDAVSVLTDSKNSLLLGRLIIDSLREDYPRDVKYGAKEYQEVIEDMDILTMREMLSGIAKANKKVFGPLGEQVVSKMGAAAKSLSLIDETPAATPAVPQTTGNS